MRLSELSYELPEELIAQHPAQERDQSRLMIVDRESRELHHLSFSDLTGYASKDDLFVLNNTRVFPARLFGKRPGLERPIEVLLLKETVLAQ